MPRLPLVLAPLAWLLVAGCTSVGPVEPTMQAWVPEDGLTVPAVVRQRPPLLPCGVVGAGPPQAVERASDCVLGLLASGQPAELVIYIPDTGNADSFLQIIRADPSGVAEIIHRSTAVGLPPLWEIQRCGAVADGRRSEVGGSVIGFLRIFNCGPLTPIGD